ncbi:MAG: glycosyltransferase [Gemmatimonadaceae bacterium]
MTRRIQILSGIQLSTNPRVLKEANTLADAGYDVEVVGATLQPELLERDRRLFANRQWRYTPLVDASSSSRSARLKWLMARTRRRVAREAYVRFRIETPYQLGYVAPEMLRHALENPADLFILHNPQPLWAGAELMRRNRKVAVDFEDWYSEDLLPDDRKTQPVAALRRWEALVIRGAAYSTTTSQSLSRALAAAYDCRPPAVVYNSFPFSERDFIDGETCDRVDLRLPSVTWFSQMVGPGRGLETLMEALPKVESVFEIHLRGTCREDYRASLLERAPESWRSRIYFHSQVPHRELLSRIAEHDVGLAAEIPFCQSRALTITNKLLQYFLAGVAVAASDTEGQREAAALAAGAVVLFPAGDPYGVATALDSLLGDPARLRLARQTALAAAQNEFGWDRSARVLLDQVERVMLPSAGGFSGEGTAARKSF